MFISKSNKIYQWEDFSSTRILNNEELLSEYSLKELNEVYKQNRLGNLQFLYKDILLKQSAIYDHSDNVNSFIYKDNKYWLDKQQRSCMRTIIESGLDIIEIVLGTEILALPAETVKQFIIQLETYAYKCYIVTTKHQQNISSLQNLEDLYNYNYTVGYPEKIVLK